MSTTSESTCLARSRETRCAVCLYWVPHLLPSGKLAYGECHRFPPTAQRVPVRGALDQFPDVFDWMSNRPHPSPDDWCGEFVQRPAAKGPDPCARQGACPFCQSTREPYYSRVAPMGYFCPDCGASA